MIKPIFSIAILMAMFTTACQPNTELTMQPTEITTKASTSTTTTQVPTTTASPGDIDKDLITAFNLLLVPECSAADLADFMVNHIDGATPAEADTMMAWLLVYQTELIEEMSQKIYTEPYIQALNETMGGLIDPKKVSTIKDPQVMQDFNAVIDGYMTVVRYEETPVIEPDWQRLATFSGRCSNAFATMLRLNSTQYTPTADTIYAYCEDLVQVESLVKATNRGFLKGWLASLHRTMVTTALYGPEGTYMNSLFRKEGDLYKNLVAFSNDYPETGFAQLVKQIEAGSWTETRTPRNMISEYIYFNYGSPYAWTSSTALIGENMIDLLVLTSNPTTVVTDKVNAHILHSFSERASNLNWTTFKGNTTTGYGTGNYTSVFFLLSDESNPDQINYVNWLYTYDLNTGEPITVADYLNLSDAQALTVINTLSGTNFETLPDFEIFKNGIILRAAKNETSTSRYAALTLKDLIPYVKEPQLYR